MLEFNPWFRKSPKELLKMKVFDQIRKESMEVDAPFKITLEIDQDDVFDYEECKFADKVTIDYIKEKFLAEVKLIQEHKYKHSNTS